MKIRTNDPEALWKIRAPTCRIDLKAPSFLHFELDPDVRSLSRHTVAILGFFFRPLSD
jgi:hypothetical protein